MTRVSPPICSPSSSTRHGCSRRAGTRLAHCPCRVPRHSSWWAPQANAIAHAAEAASLHAFHLGLAIAAALVAGGGVVGFAGVRNRRVDVSARDCSGGQLVGASRELAHVSLGAAADPATAKASGSPA